MRSVKYTITPERLSGKNTVIIWEQTRSKYIYIKLLLYSSARSFYEAKTARQRVYKAAPILIGGTKIPLKKRIPFLLTYIGNFQVY